MKHIYRFFLFTHCVYFWVSICWVTFIMVDSLWLVLRLLLTVLPLGPVAPAAPWGPGGPRGPGNPGAPATPAAPCRGRQTATTQSNRAVLLVMSLCSCCNCETAAWPSWSVLPWQKEPPNKHASKLKCVKWDTYRGSLGTSGSIISRVSLQEE